MSKLGRKKKLCVAFFPHMKSSFRPNSKTVICQYTGIWYCKKASVLKPVKRSLLLSGVFARHLPINQPTRHGDSAVNTYTTLFQIVDLQ